MTLFRKNLSSNMQEATSLGQFQSLPLSVSRCIRAEAILPIGDALVSKGMGIGSVIALLIGGAGASIPEVVLLSKFFKKKLVIIFVSSILIVAISTGFILQIFL